MQFQTYSDVNDFYNATFDFFMRHEAQNLIPLGNVIMGKKGENKSDWRDPANWLMLTVSNGSCIKLAAVMTPPHNLTPCILDNIIDDAVIGCLVEGLVDIQVPGVMARKNLADHFAAHYCNTRGLKYKTVEEHCVYELTQVNPSIAPSGKLRSANEGDMYFYPYWQEAFMAETFGAGESGMAIPTDIEHYRNRIKTSKVHILEDEGIPVSMVGINREMQTVCGIANVYTPPYFRGRSYATSAVATLSQIVLDSGYAKCVLYADSSNQTANSIYQKIGYRPVCVSSMIKFAPMHPTCTTANFHIECSK